MLFAVGSANGQMYRSPLQLSGLADSDPSVMVMQQALLALSQRAMNPLINPGPATGTVNVQTMNAIVAALDLLVAQLPTAIGAGLKAGLQNGAQSTDAQNFVAQYAAIISEAATVATAALPAPNPVSSFAYTVKQSPALWLMGIGALFLGYRLFFAKPSNG